MSYLRIQERFAVHCSYTAALVSITGVFYSIINKLSFIMSKSLSLNLSNENKHCFFVVLKTECELKCQFSSITEIFWFTANPNPVSQFPQRKTCFHYREPLFSMQGPCFHYRGFPLNACTSLLGIAVFLNDNPFLTL